MLRLSDPSDAYEQEAERVSEEIVAMQAPILPVAETIESEKEMKTECPACEMKEGERNQKLNISLKSSSSSPASELDDETAESINDIRASGGFPLDQNTREFMESRFAYDFSGVRLHTDERAARSAHSINALAYTIGNDIIFAEGQYAPSSLTGKKILAHELTHVLQQSGAARMFRNGSGKLSLARERSNDNPYVYRDPPDVDSDRAFKRRYIYYSKEDAQDPRLPERKTDWGTVWWPADDDSSFAGTAGFWGGPYQKDGIGRATLYTWYEDFRDMKISNETYHPSLEATVRWEQRRGFEKLSISPGAVDYNPDGGGGVNVTVQYSYGGYEQIDGKKIGHHNLLFNVTYSPNMTKESGTEVGIGAEYKGVKGEAKASSNVTVSTSALSYSREIAFSSYDLDAD